MDDIKILPNVSIPSVKLQSVRMPIVGNRITLPSGGGGILNDLKSHMIGWYDVKRQGCTNESLTANPVLEDLSGNNHPLELKNFVFGGLSGMGTEMYPNSLVFNGVTPEYVINRENVTLSNVATAVGVNKFKLTGNNQKAIIHYITGKAGEPLTVSIPSFMLRTSGFEANSLVQINYKDSTGNYTYRNLVNNGSFIIPAIEYTLDAKEDGSAIKEEAIRVLTDGDIHDVTLEFLPNYPAPTTRMYGAIPSLTHGAKCMMMDFVPTFCGAGEYDCYYASMAEDFNYAIFTVGRTGIAYNDRNKNGTYINGVYNNIRAYELTQRRQVVAVNCNEPPTNINNGICIASDNRNLPGYLTQMALNSLILFDRELTEEEMKLVMDKLMMYQDVDNIADINHDIGLQIMGTADPNMDLD